MEQATKDRLVSLWNATEVDSTLYGTTCGYDTCSEIMLTGLDTGNLELVILGDNIEYKPPGWNHKPRRMIAKFAVSLIEIALPENAIEDYRP